MRETDTLFELSQGWEALDSGRGSNIRVRWIE